MFITLLALSFTFAASQSRMRPISSDSTQSSQEDIVLANSHSDNDETIMLQGQETHDTDLIYRRSRFSDVDYTQFAISSDISREQVVCSDNQEYGNFLGVSPSNN